MKKFNKVFLCLMSISALVGCASDKTSTIVSSTNSSTSTSSESSQDVSLSSPSSSQSSSESSSENIQPESIQIKNKENVLALGEVLELNVEVLPSTVSQEFEVSLSDDTYLSVEGNKITANRVSNGVKTTVTVKTANNKSDSFDIEVVQPLDKGVSTLKSLLNNSLEREKTEIKTANFKVDVTGYYDGKPSTSSSYKQDQSFTIYSDNKSESIYQLGSTSLTNYLKVTRQVGSDGKFYSIGYDDKGSVNSYSSLTGFDTNENARVLPGLIPNLANSFSTVYISNLVFGGSKYVIDKLLDDSYNFGVGDKIGVQSTFSKENNSYTLTLPKQTIGSNTYEEQLTVNFSDDGLLTSFVNVYKSYKNDVLSQEKHLEYTQVGGQREQAGEDFVKPETYFYTDFDASFGTSSYSSTSLSEFEVGKTAALIVKNKKPTNVISKFDAIKITKVEPEDAATISTDGQKLTVKKASDNVKVTVQSKNVTKEVNLKFKEHQVTPLTSLKFTSGSDTSLFSTYALGAEYTFTVDYLPKVDKEDLKLTVTSSDTSIVTVTKDTYYANKFKLKGLKAGKVTITVKDDFNNVTPITKEVTFSEATDDNYATRFSSLKYTINNGGSDLKITKDENANSGSISFKYNNETLSANWSITGWKANKYSNSFKLTNITNSKNGSTLISKIITTNSAKYDVNHISIQLNINTEDDEGDEVPVTIDLFAE